MCAADAAEAEHDVVAREGRRCGEGDRDREPEGVRLREAEDELAKPEGQARGDDTNEDGAKPARAGVVGEAPGGDARKQWQGEDRHVEHERDQEADAGQADDHSDDHDVFSSC